MVFAPVISATKHHALYYTGLISLIFIVTILAQPTVELLVTISFIKSLILVVAVNKEKPAQTSIKLVILFTVALMVVILDSPLRMLDS